MIPSLINLRINFSKITRTYLLFLWQEIHAECIDLDLIQLFYMDLQNRRARRRLHPVHTMIASFL